MNFLLYGGVLGQVCSREALFLRGILSYLAVTGNQPHLCEIQKPTEHCLYCLVFDTVITIKGYYCPLLNFQMSVYCY